MVSFRDVYIVFLTISRCDVHLDLEERVLGLCVLDT